MNHIQERIQVCLAKIIQNNPEVKNIFDEIYQQEGRVLLVGGAVRDCLLGCLGSDLDFEVYHLSFEELQDILQKFGNVSFVGKSFGVLRLHGLNADWSIPRSDSYGRKPTVHLDPDMSFEQAFRRRDVTINAMGIDIFSQELIDPFDGQIDLKNKVLKAPDATFFVQDPLRLFRVMQFVARFDMRVDETLSQICRTMDISDISSERIEQEFKKLFIKAHKPSIGLRWLSEIDRVKDVFSGVKFTDQLYKNIDCLAKHDDISDEQKIAGMWALILQMKIVDFNNHIVLDQKIPAAYVTQSAQFLKKYIGSSDIIDQAIMMSYYVYYVSHLAQEKNMAFYKWLAYFIAPYFSMQTLGVIASCCQSEENADQFIQKATAAKVLHKAEEPLLIGKDLLNYAQGKELGELVKKAYEVQLNLAITDPKKLLQKILKNS